MPTLVRWDWNIIYKFAYLLFKKILSYEPNEVTTLYLVVKLLRNETTIDITPSGVSTSSSRYTIDYCKYNFCGDFIHEECTVVAFVLEETILLYL